MRKSTSLNRRDILKLGMFAPASMMLSKASQKIKGGTKKPNIIVIVLDALTASSMSLYGHVRQTTPNMERFASKSNVYHSHYSGGTFTTSGTSSLLTGTYPWKHRAINLFGYVTEKYTNRNIFNLLGSEYFRTAFTQNPYADILLSQFGASIDRHYEIDSFAKINLYSHDNNDRVLFEKYIYDDSFLYAENPASLFFGTLKKYAYEFKKDRLMTPANEKIIGGVPRLFFSVEDVFSGMAGEVPASPDSSFVYYHFYPPHQPYIISPEVENLFTDAWEHVNKPIHSLSTNATTQEETAELLLMYERYLARTDMAFGSFINHLEENGYFENSYIILTSDHGELFERGAIGHLTPLVYEGGIHIPLIVHSPGQTERKNFFTPTSAVDVMPTLLSIANRDIPEWCDGQLLPGFGGTEDATRKIFTMDAKLSTPSQELKIISIAMRQGNNKLHYFKGFTDYRGARKNDSYRRGKFELYNIANDPHEITDLLDSQTDLASSMKDSLLQAYDQSKNFNNL